MTLFEKIAHYARVWRVALPHVAMPEPQDSVRWASYPIDIVEEAILVTARRFALDRLSDGFEPIDAYRYTTATARQMIERGIPLTRTAQQSVHNNLKENLQ